MMNGQPVHRHAAHWAWLVIAFGAVLRLQGLDWDQGLLLHPDERNIAVAASRLAFPAGLIPEFHAYNGLSLYLPRLLAEALSPWTGRSGADMAAIVLAGRVLSAICSVLALPVLWSAARRALGVEGGLLALIAVAASPALIQAAHFATTESGLVLCLVTLLWLSIRHTSGALPLMAFAALSGVVLGLGFGLKTTALVFAILPLVAVTDTTLLRRRIGPAKASARKVRAVFGQADAQKQRDRAPGRFYENARRAIGAGMVSLGLLGLVALATTPQIWATPQAYFDTMRFESAVVSGAADVFWTYQFTGAQNGLFELSQLPWLVGPAVAPLGLAGITVLLYRLSRGDPAARSLAGAALFTLLYAAIICSWHAKFIRYLILIIPPLALFTGYFISQIASDWLRLFVATVVVVATVAAGLAQAAIYQVTDARIAAWHWLASELRPGDRLVVEPVDLGPPYGEPAAPAIETAVLPLLDPPSPRKLEQMAEALSTARFMVIASRRHYGVLPRLKERFPELCGYYDALWSGRLGYDVVARFKRRPAWPSLIDPEIQAEETLTVFDSPTVIILANVARLPPERIRTEILTNTAQCRE